MFRSSWTQNSSRWPSSHSMGNSSSPKKVASTWSSPMPRPRSLVGGQHFRDHRTDYPTNGEQKAAPMQQLNDRVYTETTVRGCNPSFVVTSAGTVVIDTPQLPTRAVAMRKEVESHGPIRYLVNTEHHVHPIFGNPWFRGPGAVVNHKGLYDNFMVVYPELDPFEYAREAIPTDDPDGAALFPDRDAYYADPNKGTIVFTGDLSLRVGD